MPFPNLLESSGMFTEAKHIFQAKVPVIKLETNDEFKCKKVDITLIDKKHNGLECADTIISYLKKYPMLKSIFLVLKEMLFLASLNDPSQVEFLISGWTEQLWPVSDFGGLLSKERDRGRQVKGGVPHAGHSLHGLLQFLQFSGIAQLRNQTHAPG